MTPQLCWSTVVAHGRTTSSVRSKTIVLRQQHFKINFHSRSLEPWFNHGDSSPELWMRIDCCEKSRRNTPLATF